MELIPILSTIILVATISTFILAVGAYILFKIREGKTQKKPVNEPANLYAEYILPNDKVDNIRFLNKLYIPLLSMPFLLVIFAIIRNADFAGFIILIITICPLASNILYKLALKEGKEIT